LLLCTPYAAGGLPDGDNNTPRGAAAQPVMTLLKEDSYMIRFEACDVPLDSILAGSYQQQCPFLLVTS
jgi:hypothetical protein